MAATELRGTPPVPQAARPLKQAPPPEIPPPPEGTGNGKKRGRRPSPLKAARRELETAADAVWPAHKRAVRKLLSIARRESRAAGRAALTPPGTHIDPWPLDMRPHTAVVADRARLEEALRTLIGRFEAYCDIEGMARDPVAKPRYAEPVEKAIEREKARMGKGR